MGPWVGVNARNRERSDNSAQETQFISRIIEFLGYAPYDSSLAVGQRLKAIRTALGLSQEQFAEKLGVDESTVASWEREEHQRSRQKVLALKEFLKSLT